MPKKEQMKVLFETNSLSPNARALLSVIERIEKGESIQLFQRDPSFDRYEQMVATWRPKGGLFDALCNRLVSLIDLGNIGVITSSDLNQIMESLWRGNISKLSETELRFLSSVFNVPGESLRLHSSLARLSYSQCRRANKRLTETGNLQVRSALDTERLSLTRLLLVLDRPEFILQGPWITSTLFIDGTSPMVFQVLSVPTTNLDDIVIRALRTVSRRSTIWRMSPGSMAFNGQWYNRRYGWQPDFMHWALILRANLGNTLTMSSPSRGERTPPELGPSELKVIQTLQTNYHFTAKEISERCGISEATAFRLRSVIMNNGYVIPRPVLNIPGHLDDRVIGLLEADAACEYYAASDLLPLTYSTICENIDDPTEKRALFYSALPSGSARKLVEVAKTEMSRALDPQFSIVSSGYSDQIRVTSLYDRRAKQWKARSDFYDARTTATVRMECDNGDLPIDLA